MYGSYIINSFYRHVQKNPSTLPSLNVILFRDVTCFQTERKSILVSKCQKGYLHIRIVAAMKINLQAFVNNEIWRSTFREDFVIFFS